MLACVTKSVLLALSLPQANFRKIHFWEFKQAVTDEEDVPTERIKACIRMVKKRRKINIYVAADGFQAKVLCFLPLPRNKETAAPSINNSQSTLRGSCSNRDRDRSGQTGAGGGGGDGGWQRWVRAPLER
ncbi:hypothetical protein JOB18_014945 [Solea senegalensis]|uniref:Uncharacterized protein n=1 Tax=Solea senegalensis TaxID=28829 RepID=A0AAV6SK45_SOLSE|nr:hypothetical protein JOB18_014945 [Solea senegalensis]